MTETMQWLEQIGQNYKFTIQAVNTFFPLVFALIVISWLNRLQKQVIFLGEAATNTKRNER